MKQNSKISNETGERLFELAIFLVGLVGLLVLFTLLFAGPRFIFNKTLEFLNITI